MPIMTTNGFFHRDDKVRRINITNIYYLGCQNYGVKLIHIYKNIKKIEIFLLMVFKNVAN